MAKITFSGGISAASGSVGGNVFSRNASGAYLRNKGIPTNTNTVPQQLARARFGSVSQIWGGLSDAQKQSFVDQVTAYPYIDSLGQSKTYTPSQLCNVVNQRILQTNAIPLTSGDGLPAPVVQFMPPPVAFPFVEDATVEYILSGNSFRYTVGLSDAAASLPDGSILIIAATAPLSSGITRPKAPMFRNIATLGSNEPVAAVVLAENFYLNVFGQEITAASYVYFQFTVLNTDTGVYSTSVNTLVSVIP